VRLVRCVQHQEDTSNNSGELYVSVQALYKYPSHRAHDCSSDMWSVGRYAMFASG
jgi:hypothetical protein